MRTLQGETDRCDRNRLCYEKIRKPAEQTYILEVFRFGPGGHHLRYGEGRFCVPGPSRQWRGRFGGVSGPGPRSRESGKSPPGHGFHPELFARQYASHCCVSIRHGSLDHPVHRRYCVDVSSRRPAHPGVPLHSPTQSLVNHYGHATLPPLLRCNQSSSIGTLELRQPARCRARTTQPPIAPGALWHRRRIDTDPTMRAHSSILFQARRSRLPLRHPEDTLSGGASGRCPTARFSSRPPPIPEVSPMVSPLTTWCSSRSHG